VKHSPPRFTLQDAVSYPHTHTHTQTHTHNLLKGLGIYVVNETLNEGGKRGQETSLLQRRGRQLK